MARRKLELEKCKISVGKTVIEYDLQLLAKDGNVLANIGVYKESGMTETQKKAICKKLKLTLDELIKNGI
jgi:hypothetical protein